MYVCTVSHMGIDQVTCYLMCSSPQIAYYRQYKGCVPTYESCSTAAFRHGRTETIRSATMATKACAEAFERSSPADVETMMKLIKESVVWHSKLVKEAATGEQRDEGGLSTCV